MNYSPFVSILISNYNYGHYIPKLLKKLLKQTYKNFEIIISDNCSSDNSVQVIHDFSKIDDRIILYTQEKNIGMVGNWEFLRRKATGDYLWFINADDLVYEDNFLEILVNKINEFNVDFILAKKLFYFENVKNLNGQNLCKIDAPFDLKPKIIYDKSVLLQPYISYPFIGQYIFKKRDLEFNLKRMYGGDFDYFIRYIVKYEPNIMYVDDVTFIFRVHGNNLGYYIPLDKLKLELINENSTFEAIVRDSKDTEWGLKYLQKLRSDMFLSVLIHIALKKYRNEINIKQFFEFLSFATTHYLKCAYSMIYLPKNLLNLALYLFRNKLIKKNHVYFYKKIIFD